MRRRLVKPSVVHGDFCQQSETRPLSRRSEPPAQERGSRRRRGPRCSIVKDSVLDLPSPRQSRSPHVLSWRLRGRRSRMAPPHLLSVAVLRTAHPRLHSGSLEASRPSHPRCPSAPGLFDGDSHQLAYSRARRATSQWFTPPGSSRSPRLESPRGRHTATAQLTACVPPRRSLCAASVCSRGQIAADTTESTHSPADTGPSSTRVAPSDGAHVYCRRA